MTIAARKPAAIVVDDQFLIAMSLEAMLIELGFDVKVCQDAEETLAALAVTPFDLAVVDFHLSRGTSESIIDELRRRAIPYALCSGSMEDELRESFGDAVTVTKPFTDETIRAAVDQLIGARSFA